MPVKVGPCRGMVFSYFYNKATGACESFGYGGCKGNGNRFSSVEECQATCVNKTLPSLAAVRARSEQNQGGKQPEISRLSFMLNLNSFDFF